MSTKMEQLLDLIVNEEMDKANELFHEIVVEKSREIYENLIAEEAEEEESVEEASKEDDEEQDESVEEGFGMDDETSSEIGGDASDDMVSDIEDPEAMGGDDMGGDDMGGEEPATKADVMDLQDALDELTREFEALMGGESGEEDGPPGDEEGEMDSDFGDEEGDSDEEADDEDESMGSVMREYRETVGNDWHKNSMKSPGPVGSGTGDKAGQATETNTRSPVSSAKGKLSTTANAHNIAQGDKGVGENTGTSPNGKTGGLVGGVKGQFTKGVEKNIAASSKTGMKDGAALASVAKSNRTGEGQPVGAGHGDKAGQTGGSTNTRSPADRRQ